VGFYAKSLNLIPNFIYSTVKQFAKKFGEICQLGI